jgi:acetyl-CoA carboxylase biotin carboxylase subunit
MIVWGKNREFAINRAKRTLEEFHVENIKTTIPFHLKVLNNEHFINNDYDTSFIDKYL